MSDRFTSITLPGGAMSGGGGMADRGLKDAQTMIERYRRFAKIRYEHYKQVLEADDSDFLIETYVGAFVERNKKTIQKGRA